MSVNPFKVYCKHLIVLLVVFYTFTAQSQDYHQQFTVANGLPSNEIYDIYQDVNGLIWIATDHGIASYNGSYFTTYNTQDGLPDRVVFKFYPQSDGNIWCTTKSNELFYFDPDKTDFRMYQFNEDLKRELNPNVQMRALKLHDDGKISFRSISFPYTYQVSSNGTIETYECNSGEIAYTYKELSVRQGDDGYSFFNCSKQGKSTQRAFQRTNLLEFGDYSLISHTEGFAAFHNGQLIKEDQQEGHFILDSELTDDGYWIAGVNCGIRLIDVNGTVVNQLADEITGTTYMKDRDGGQWIGTQDDGILYYPNNKVKLIMASKNNSIVSVCENKDGNLVFSATNGEVYAYDFATSQILHKHKSNVLYSPAEYYPSVDKEYRSIFLSNEDIRRQNLGHAKVRRYSDDKFAKPLLITYSAILDENLQKLYRITPPRKKRFADAEHLAENIVIAEGDTLTIIAPDSTLLVKKNVGSDIRDIDVHNKNIYCATEGKGLLVFDSKLKLLFTVNADNGVPSNFISEVLIDKDKIWMGTDKGLARALATKSGIKVSSIRTNNGLYNEEVKDICIINEQMFVGTNNGVFYFDTNDWSEITNEFVKIYFQKKELLVNGSSVSSTLNLSHRSNEIEVRFDLISFVNSRELTFRYRLLGLNNEWNVTTDRKVLYKSLPPGEYELEIQPVINGVPRKEVIRQKISINEPYYRTWWFITVVILGIVLATWLFFRYRIIEKNSMLIREILRLTMKRLQPKTKSFVVRSNGKSIRINCEDILFAESNGNYLNIHTEDDKIVIREKISNFNEIVPDPLEYIRVRRSVIVRKDKITGKNGEVIIVRKHEIKIGNTYRKDVDSIEL